MRVGFDSNVIVYAEGLNGLSRQSEALQVIDRIPPEDQVLPAQALAEVFNVLTRKGGMSRVEALEHVERWQRPRTVAPTTWEILRSALELSAKHGLEVWDSVILAAAESAGCRMLLSQDMHEGFSWNGITIVNPFAPQRHWLLAAAIGEPE